MANLYLSLLRTMDRLPCSSRNGYLFWRDIKKRWKIHLCSLVSLLSFFCATASTSEGKREKKFAHHSIKDVRKLDWFIRCEEIVFGSIFIHLFRATEHFQLSIFDFSFISVQTRLGSCCEETNKCGRKLEVLYFKSQNYITLISQWFEVVCWNCFCISHHRA